MGNHRRLREHNVAFVDGHARPVLYEVRSDVTNLDWDLARVIHSGNFQIRGSRLEWYNYRRGTPDDEAFDALKHLIYSGPGWKEHCLPAPIFLDPELRW